MKRFKILRQYGMAGYMNNNQINAGQTVNAAGNMQGKNYGQASGIAGVFQMVGKAGENTTAGQISRDAYGRPTENKENQVWGAGQSAFNPAKYGMMIAQNKNLSNKEKAIGLAGNFMLPGLGAKIQQRGERRAGDLLAAQNNAANFAQWGNQQIANQPQYNYMQPMAGGGKLYPNGGTMVNYTGQRHEGKDGGVEVDAQGNPTVTTGQQPVGLVEGGEVSYKSKDGQVFVFSDRLGYAKQAKKIMGKYKHSDTDAIEKSGLEKELGRLANEQEAYKAQIEELSQQNGEEETQESVNEENTEDMNTMAKGGDLSAAKARVMLHEGVANQHAITDKQRKYFAWVSGGRKANGGNLNKYPDGGNVAQDVQATPTGGAINAADIQRANDWLREPSGSSLPELSKRARYDVLFDQSAWDNAATHQDVKNVRNTFEADQPQIANLLRNESGIVDYGKLKQIYRQSPSGAWEFDTDAISKGFGNTQTNPNPVGTQKFIRSRSPFEIKNQGYLKSEFNKGQFSTPSDKPQEMARGGVISQNIYDKLGADYHVQKYVGGGNVMTNYGRVHGGVLPGFGDGTKDLAMQSSAKKIKDAGDYIENTENTGTSGKQFKGNYNYLIPVSQVVGDVAMLAAQKKMQPKGIGAPKLTAREINLASQRAQIKADAMATQRANQMAMRNANINPTQYMSAVGVGNVASQKAANEALLQSGLSEQQYNAGIANQFTGMNAQRQMQADMYNAQLKNYYNQQRLGLLSDIAATPTNTMSDIQNIRQQEMQTQRMQPYYDYNQSPDNKWYNTITGTNKYNKQVSQYGKKIGTMPVGNPYNRANGGNLSPYAKYINSYNPYAKMCGGKLSNGGRLKQVQVTR